MKTITIITSFIFCFALQGQQLQSLGYNHAITKATKNYEKAQLATSVNNIIFDKHFIEDFTSYHYQVLPKSDHWLDQNVYINSNYSDSMINLGIATLDAFDWRGHTYYDRDHLVAESDKLTSQPFEFPTTPEETVYFSFFFQAGGKGDLPEGIISSGEGEGKDSLLVDFYSVDESQWENVFYTLDNTDSNHFHQIIFEVDPIFLKDGFQFRFRNYTSYPNPPPGYDYGRISQADLWHIDYIQLMETDNQSDLENLNDVLLTKPLPSSIEEYTAVPWTHFTAASMSEQNSNIVPLTVRSYFPARNDDIEKVYRSFFSYDQSEGEKTLLNSYVGSHFTMNANQVNNWEDRFRTELVYDAEDTIGIVETVAFIETAEEQRTENDTVRRMETFFDHYAYDDGSAEMGIGIKGEPEGNSRLAIRFRAFRRSSNPDLLHGVLIYFAKSVEDTTDNYSYRLSIRKNDGIFPASEELFSTNADLTPDHSLANNEFTRIEIDPPISISDTFFVVIDQIDGYLNIGYDINNNSTQNIFDYRHHEWQNSQLEIPGSIMIRPSFGEYSLPTEVNTLVETDEILVYPNPVNDELNLSGEALSREGTQIQIYNLMGVLVRTYTTPLERILVSDLNSGMYFIRFNSNAGHKIQTAKFIKK